MADTFLAPIMVRGCGRPLWNLCSHFSRAYLPRSYTWFGVGQAPLEPLFPFFEGLPPSLIYMVRGGSGPFGTSAHIVKRIGRYSYLPRLKLVWGVGQPLSSHWLEGQVGMFTFLAFDSGNPGKSQAPYVYLEPWFPSP